MNIESTRIYRKKRGTNMWHFCSNCADWPKEEYEEQQRIPLSGQLCNECRAKEKDKDCHKS